MKNPGRLQRHLLLTTIVAALLSGFAACTSPTSGSPNDTDRVYSVGSGYNIFDEYANAADVKDPILDYSKMLAAGAVSVTNAESAEYRTVEGSDEATYEESLGVDIGISGSYGAFSGSVESHFSTSSSGETSTAYVTIQALIKKKSVHIGSSYVSDPSSLRAFLTDAAKAAIDGTDGSYADPTAVFRAFGTHVLTWGYYGGRLDYNCETNTEKYTGSTSVEVLAKAAFDNGIASVSTDLGTKYGSDWSSFSTNTTTTLYLVGGSSQAGFSILSKNDYDAWTSVFDDADHQVLCAFETGTGNTSLLPIWLLCDTATDAGKARQTTLRNAFATWAETATAGDTSTGTLYVKLYHIYNQDADMGDDDAAPDLYWNYGYNLVGLNQTGTLHSHGETTPEDDNFPLSTGNYVDFTSDGSLSGQHATSDGTYVSVALPISSTSSLTAAYFPLKMYDYDTSNADDALANPDHTIFKFAYDTSSDSFSTDGNYVEWTSEAGDTVHTYLAFEDGDDSNVPTAPGEFTIKRGEGEKLLDLVCNVNGTYLWTKVGIIWK